MEEKFNQTVFEASDAKQAQLRRTFRNKGQMSMVTPDLSKFYKMKSLATASTDVGRTIVSGGVQEIVAREMFLEAWELFVEQIGGVK